MRIVGRVPDRVVGLCAAGQARASPKASIPSRSARLKADLTFLSSDALEGRRSLERGSEVAIQWIASEFAKAGLKPLVGESYLQPVPIIEFTADRALTSLVVRHGDKSRDLPRARRHGQLRQ